MSRIQGAEATLMTAPVARAAISGAINFTPRMYAPDDTKDYQT
ncbi:hypothetical protein [Arthrobacter psychrolactophilus]